MIDVIRHDILGKGTVQEIFEAIPVLEVILNLEVVGILNDCDLLGILNDIVFALVNKLLYS